MAEGSIKGTESHLVDKESGQVVEKRREVSGTYSNSPIPLAELNKFMTDHPDLKQQSWDFFTKRAEVEQANSIKLRDKNHDYYYDCVKMELTDNSRLINWAGVLTLAFIATTIIALYLGYPWVAGSTGVGSIASVIVAFLEKRRQDKTKDKLNDPADYEEE